MAIPSPAMDWRSRLLEMMPVRGQLDLRCFYGAPWRIDEVRAEPGEIPYQAVLDGSAMLDDPAGCPPRRLVAGDILLLPGGEAHRLHDGSGALPIPARTRAGLAVTISANTGTGERLGMLCGRFVLSSQHDRFLRDYMPTQMVVHAAEHSAATARPGTGAQLAALLSLMRNEAAAENLGGRAMLNALSTALFALTLRFASEAAEASQASWRSFGIRALHPPWRRC